MHAPASVIDRAALYERVWMQPMTKVAADFRISGSGLAKVCRKWNIPVPPRGYWNKRQHGKPVMARPPLPPMGNGSGNKISIQPSHPPADADPVVTARVAAEQKPENRIQVADQLRTPHPLIREASAAFPKGGAGRRGITGTGSGSGHAGPVLDIRVSPSARSRALRLLDALLKALEARGYSVSARGVTIEGEMVPIRLTEKEDRVPHVPTAAELAEKRRAPWARIPTWDSVPNGKLSIHSNVYLGYRNGIRRRWSDGRSARLENMLNDIVVGLVAIGSVLRQQAEERRREAEAWAEQQRLRQERERQARIEKARREALIASTDAWTTAERIRLFVAAVERRSTSGGEAMPEELRTWVAWASRVVAELDPLAAGPGELLRKDAQVAEEADRHPAYGYGRCG